MGGVQALVASCITQIDNLTRLLHTSAKAELETLMTQMAPGSYALTRAPKTLPALAKALETHKARGGAAALEERFQPLYDVYDLLSRKEVKLPQCGLECLRVPDNHREVGALSNMTCCQARLHHGWSHGEAWPVWAAAACCAGAGGCCRAWEDGQLQSAAWAMRRRHAKLIVFI